MSNAYNNWHMSYNLRALEYFKKTAVSDDVAEIFEAEKEKKQPRYWDALYNSNNPEAKAIALKIREPMEKTDNKYMKEHYRHRAASMSNGVNQMQGAYKFAYHMIQREN